jgi:hypothetical protein
LRKLNGIIKKLGKRKPHTGNRRSSYYRYYYLLPVLWVGGCTSLKKAALIGGTTSLAAGVGSVASSGALVPAVAGGLAASVMSVSADLSSEKTGDTTLNNCADTNFWDVVGQLIEMGGWFLILVVLIPMAAGWILPGPLERKKK